MMEIIGRERKKAKRPPVNIRPSSALVGVGGIVPSMVRAIEEITSTINIIKKRGLFLALLRGEKSRKGSIRRKIRVRLKATKPRTLSGMDLNMV